MNDFENEKLYWKNKFDSGEIDLNTYNKQIEMIELRYNFNARTKNKYINRINRMSKKTKIIIVVVIIILVGYIYQKFFYIDKSRYIDADLTNLEAPIQIGAEGNATKIIDGIIVEIDYIASYTISGRVVKTFSYLPLTMQNKISPKDVGLTWGFLAQDEYNNKVQWKATGNRFLNWRVEDGDWYRNTIGESNFQEHVSNNHLIDSNDEIKNLINKIKENDYVKITGYLVNVYYKRSDGYTYNWRSSSSRGDTGAGACELIYVTDVNWLK